MADIIQGIVTNILDGETFELKVTGEAQDNQFIYKSTERVKIAATVLPINPTDRKMAKLNLEEYIGGAEVICNVINRDRYSNIIATIKVFTMV